MSPPVSDGRKDLIANAERLRLLLAACATGGTREPEEYKQLRGELLSSPLVQSKLPTFIRTCRNLADFWSFIKLKFDNYEARRTFLREEFEPLLMTLEEESVPVDDSISGILSTVDSERIRQAWQKALDRRSSDPEGAITAARTLLETVCKHLLDETGTPYDASDDLPTLYKALAGRLDLSPGKQVDALLKRVLGGCQTIVEGLGSLRNRLSDAHGVGKADTRPEQSQAELAVNLAGAMALFILEAWEASKPQQ